jgi:hypothetical protein
MNSRVTHRGKALVAKASVVLAGAAIVGSMVAPAAAAADPLWRLQDTYGSAIGCTLAGRIGLIEHRWVRFKCLGGQLWVANN